MEQAAQAKSAPQPKALPEITGQLEDARSRWQFLQVLEDVEDHSLAQRPARPAQAQRSDPVCHPRAFAEAEALRPESFADRGAAFAIGPLVMWPVGLEPKAVAVPADGVPGEAENLRDLGVV